MKTVKSSLLGTRQLIDRRPDAILWQLAQFLKEHRAVIITRLIGDLPTYLAYKFELTKPTKEQLNEIKDKLVALKNSEIMMKDFEAIVVQIDSKSVIHLTSELFYAQIDEYLKPLVNDSQLKFA